jgi:hypothetical protein
VLMSRMKVTIVLLVTFDVSRMWDIYIYIYYLLNTVLGHISRYALNITS